MTQIFHSTNSFQQTQSYCYSFAISMVHIRIFNFIVPPLQTLTARTCHTSFTESNNLFPLCSKRKKKKKSSTCPYIHVGASLNTILTSSGQGSIVIFLLYNLHLLPPSPLFISQTSVIITSLIVTLYFEWLSGEI